MHFGEVIMQQDIQKQFTTPAIADDLVELFARHGILKGILTDQGTNFFSQFLLELYRMLGVKAIRSTPYHPQTDDPVERFNQTLKQILRKTRKMVTITKRAGVIPYIFSFSIALPSSLLSFRFYLLDFKTISSVDILEMT